MYEYIKGKLVFANTFHAIIEAQGVGYKLLIGSNSHANMPPLNEEMLLYTSLVVRENSQQLFGFISQHERTLFETLMTVSGIGPKIALSLVGSLPPLTLQEAIAANNPALLAKVPGVGKKTAERLILELKGKLPSLLETLPHLSGGHTPLLSPTVRDAISALIHLGYTQAKAQAAIQKSLEENGEPNLQELITTALAKIQNRAS
ncbi:MAG: Holliday junction branch migration protein RuvA [Verrucomicrobia bacterium]|nr:Holliday junction branch migration protein RuvA [Verrucomicrobiota bacterium]